jgi:hypothetical protein
MWTDFRIKSNAYNDIIIFRSSIADSMDNLKLPGVERSVGSFNEYVWLLSKDHHNHNLIDTM